MQDIGSFLVSKMDTADLGKLERLIRKELRERAVNELTEAPRPTPDEFALLKEHPSKAIRHYRFRTGLSYPQATGYFEKAYGISMY